MTFQSVAQLEMKQISMPAGDAKEYPNGNSRRLWWSRKINPGPKPGATVPPYTDWGSGLSHFNYRTDLE
jgi:hypothetical protein